MTPDLTPEAVEAAASYCDMILGCQPLNDPEFVKALRTLVDVVQAALSAVPSAPDHVPGGRDVVEAIAKPGNLMTAEQCQMIAEASIWRARALKAEAALAEHLK